MIEAPAISTTFVATNRPCVWKIGSACRSRSSAVKRQTSQSVSAFETRFRFSPGGSIGTIPHELERAGYRSVAKAHKFLVTGKYGPLKAGELERARAWGTELATAAQDGAPS